MFIGLDIDDKHKRIVILNLLHCTLRVERESDNGEMIETGFRMDCFALVLGSAGEGEGLGTVEGGRGTDFLGFDRIGSLEGCLLG
jgi:hypothetical protein